MAKMYEGVKKKAVVQILENVMNTASRSGKLLIEAKKELMLCAQESYELYNEINRLKGIIKDQTTELVKNHVELKDNREEIETNSCNGDTVDSLKVVIEDKLNSIHLLKISKTRLEGILEGKEQEIVAKDDIIETQAEIIKALKEGRA